MHQLDVPSLIFDEVDAGVGGATAERGGRRKRYYTLTNSGKEALKQAKELREEMWSLVPKISFS